VNKVTCGDCIETMKKMPENSVDAIVTDPPYGLEFMGKEWDKFPLRDRGKRLTGNGNPTDARGFGKNVAYGNTLETQSALQLFSNEWATQALKILKPGGFLLAFGGTRTYHRLACAIEDAGFEIRDCILWIYGSGFPKSLDVSKAIDKMKGAEREVVGEKIAPDGIPYSKRMKEGHGPKFGDNTYGDYNNNPNLTSPSTPEAKQWNGWGTALKPACEPIVVARKPLSEKSVALNVLKWGTGGINIDGGRIGFKNEEDFKFGHHNKNLTVGNQKSGCFGVNKGYGLLDADINKGRFPANVILDEESAKFLDRQSGELSSGIMKQHIKGGSFNVYGKQYPRNVETIGDSGGASRFFYVAKASRGERNMGLKGIKPQKRDPSRKDGNPGGDNPRNRGVHKVHNFHPTVKPIKLMSYLVRLVTPPKGIVLDPFIGSGTTGMACLKEGFKFIGIEKETEYVKIAKARISHVPKRLDRFKNHTSKEGD